METILPARPYLDDRRAASITWLDALTLALLILPVTALLAWLSVARYAGYNAGMLDLGNMSQAIASVKRGRPLIMTSPSGPTSRLALHVEMIYFLFVPFYALWTDPRLLLVAQAVLFGLGAVPVYWLALRHGCNRFVAGCLAAVYLLYPTAVTSVLWDFHGDTLAMPLLLFAVDALDRRAWRSYVLFVVLAVSCKFYVAVPVALLGLLAWRYYGERRVALLTAGGALAYAAIAFLVIRPLFTTAQTPEVNRGLNYLSFYFGELRQVQATWRDRYFHALVVLGPALPLMWRGWRWFLPGLPIAAAALLSTAWGPAYAYWYHHYAVAVPFVILAVIDGAARMERGGTFTSSWQWAGLLRRVAGWLLVIVTLLVVLLVNRRYVDIPLNPGFWGGARNFGLGDGVYGVTPRDRVKDRFLAEYVPDRVPLVASPALASHVTDRDTLYLIRDPYTRPTDPFPVTLSRVDYVMADALFDFPEWGSADYEAEQIGQTLRDPHFGLVAARDGLLLFQRNPLPERRLVQRAEVVPSAPGLQPSPRWMFGHAIGLSSAQITPLGGRHFRATFTWLALGPSVAGGHEAAVSRLEGVESVRIVHLPTYALLPPAQWQPGQIVRETFDVELPGDIAPGRYTWRVGWYDLGRPDADATDARSRLPDSQEVVITTIELK